MDTAGFDAFLGTRWSDSGATLLQQAGPETEVRVTAPPRDAHVLTDTSRILRILWEENAGVLGTGHFVIEVSHR